MNNPSRKYPQGNQSNTAKPLHISVQDEDYPEEEENNSEEEAIHNSKSKVEAITNQIASMAIHSNHHSHSQPMTDKPAEKEYSPSDYPHPKNNTVSFTPSYPQNLDDLSQKTEDYEPKPNNTPQHPSTHLISANSPERQSSAEMNHFVANKAKTQQYKTHSKRRNERESPIFSYYDTSQKFLIESLFQTDETKDRANFIKKQQPLPQVQHEKSNILQGSYSNDQQSDIGSNPLMNNMNFNFFNQNMMESNSNMNTYATSPVLHSNMNQYEEKSSNNFNYFDMNPNKQGQVTSSNNQSNSKGKAFKGKAIDYTPLQPQYPQESEDSSYMASLYNKQNFFPFGMSEPQMNSSSSDPFNQNSNYQFALGNIARFQAEEELHAEPKPVAEEYIFEKFGKRGWQCEKCNNFNFESRTRCNRCDCPMQPKPLSKIGIEALGEDKKKKSLVARKGDWSCVKCKNLNFAFRQECNRCKYPKQELYGTNTGTAQMMPVSYNPYGYGNSNPGFNYIDYQNMINSNINIFNNYSGKGMMYPNMPMQGNKMMYPNSPMSSFPSSSGQFQMNPQGYYKGKPKRQSEKNSNQFNEGKYQEEEENDDSDNID